MPEERARAAAESILVSEHLTTKQGIVVREAKLKYGISSGVTFEKTLTDSVVSCCMSFAWKRPPRSSTEKNTVPSSTIASRICRTQKRQTSTASSKLIVLWSDASWSCLVRFSQTVIRAAQVWSTAPARNCETLSVPPTLRRTSANFSYRTFADRVSENAQRSAGGRNNGHRA